LSFEPLAQGWWRGVKNTRGDEGKRVERVRPKERARKDPDGEKRKEQQRRLKCEGRKKRQEEGGKQDKAGAKVTGSKTCRDRQGIWLENGFTSGGSQKTHIEY